MTEDEQLRLAIEESMREWEASAAILDAQQANGYYADMDRSNGHVLSNGHEVVECDMDRSNGHVVSNGHEVVECFEGGISRGKEDEKSNSKSDCRTDLKDGDDGCFSSQDDSVDSEIDLPADRLMDAEVSFKSLFQSSLKEVVRECSAEVFKANVKSENVEDILQMCDRESEGTISKNVMEGTSSKYFSAHDHSKAKESGKDRKSNVRTCAVDFKMSSLKERCSPCKRRRTDSNGGNNVDLDTESKNCDTQGTHSDGPGDYDIGPNGDVMAELGHQIVGDFSNVTKLSGKKSDKVNPSTDMGEQTSHGLDHPDNSANTSEQNSNGPDSTGDTERQRSHNSEQIKLQCDDEKDGMFSNTCLFYIERLCKGTFNRGRN